MNDNRVPLEIRFEQVGHQLVMTLSRTVGSELVIEHLPLGDVPREEWIESFQRAIEALRQLESPPMVSAA